MASQRKVHSLAEALVNVVIGFMLSVAVQAEVSRIYGLNLNMIQDTEIVAMFTVVSFVRSYVLRRIFNRLQSRG